MEQIQQVAEIEDPTDEGFFAIIEDLFEAVIESSDYGAITLVGILLAAAIALAIIVVPHLADILRGWRGK